MSLGLPSNARRSMPMTRVERCSLRATSRPSRPQMPVIKTAIVPSPKHVFALADAALDHVLHRAAHQLHVRLDLGIVIVGVAVEVQRLAKIDAVACGQWQ